MRLRVIDDKNRISKHQNTMAGRLREAGELRSGRWGYQGGAGGDKMYWFPDDGFWWDYQKPVEGPAPRHWNAFGLTEPAGGSAPHSITCEINIPLSNGTWRVAGAFAEDDGGGVYVVHSGKIGGGREGIGMDAFVEHFAYPQQWVRAERNGTFRDVVVVSALDDDSLIPNLAHFVKEVHRIKEAVSSGKPQPPPPGGYRREFGGRRRPYSVKAEIRARVEHGRIVHGIRDLAERMGLDVWNNQQTDLILRGKDIAMVEVKTKDAPYDRYTAIGQLLYHSKSDGDVLVAVFPSIDASFGEALERRRIVGTTWSRHGSTYKFDPELRRTLERL